MNKIVCVLVAIFFSLNLFSQELQYYNKSIIWRGFNHKWTYNHRIKGLGDYVRHNDGKDSTTHISATGTGKDSTYFTQYFTKVATPNAVFEEVVFRNVSFIGSLDDIHDFNGIFKLPLDGLGGVTFLKNKGAYATLLNGFEMHAKSPSDKLQVLRISVEDGNYNAATGNLEIPVHIGLVLNCKSAECSPKKIANYKFDVYILVVGLDKDSSAASQSYFLKTYDWDACKELKDTTINKIISGNLSKYFPYATVGIKSFGITLNTAEHMLALNSSIDTIRFLNDSKNKGSVPTNFLFKQWRKGMYGTQASRGQSLFSYRQKGYAIIDMDLVMLQFKNAVLEYGTKKEAKMFWPGHRTSLGRPAPPGSKMQFQYDPRAIKTQGTEEK